MKSVNDDKTTTTTTTDDGALVYYKLTCEPSTNFLAEYISDWKKTKIMNWTNTNKTQNLIHVHVASLTVRMSDNMARCNSATC